MYEKGRSVYYQICEQSNRGQRASVCGTGCFLCDAFIFPVYDAACHDRIEAVRYEHNVLGYILRVVPSGLESYVGISWMM